MAITGRFYLAFFVLILAQATNGEQRLERKLKPAPGTQDCEYYLLNKTVSGIWAGAWRERCKLDNQNHTIKEPSRTFTRELTGVYDPCCTEYLGLVCRLNGKPRDQGICGKPNPYQGDRKFSRTPFLAMVKKNKMDQDIDLEDRWDQIPNSPPYKKSNYY